jgi:hypothetical protein
MESSKVGYCLQVGANIGILVGLVLVAFQIKQSADLTRIQLLYQESDRASLAGIAVVGEDGAAAWAKAITAPAEMSLREQRIVETMIWLEVENWRATYRLAQLGLIEDDWKARVVENGNFNLNFPYGRSVWKHMAESVQPELAQYVNEQLASDGFNPTDYYKEIMADTLRQLGTPASD